MNAFLPVPPHRHDPPDDNPDESSHDNGSQNSDHDQDEEMPPVQENCVTEDFSIGTLKQLAIGMIMKLKSTASVPYSAVENVI